MEKTKEEKDEEDRKPTASELAAMGAQDDQGDTDSQASDRALTASRDAKKPETNLMKSDQPPKGKKKKVAASSRKRRAGSSAPSSSEGSLTDNSLGKGSSSKEAVMEGESKRERRRRLNRMSAKKKRQIKMMEMGILKKEKERLTEENEQLRDDNQHMRDRVALIRRFLPSLGRVGTSGTNASDVVAPGSAASTAVASAASDYLSQPDNQSADSPPQQRPVNTNVLPPHSLPANPAPPAASESANNDMLDRILVSQVSRSSQAFHPRPGASDAYFPGPREEEKSLEIVAELQRRIASGHESEDEKDNVLDLLRQHLASGETIPLHMGNLNLPQQQLMAGLGPAAAAVPTDNTLDQVSRYLSAIPPSFGAPSAEAKSQDGTDAPLHNLLHHRLMAVTNEQQGLRQDPAAQNQGYSALMASPQNLSGLLAFQQQRAGNFPLPGLNQFLPQRLLPQTAAASAPMFQNQSSPGLARSEQDAINFLLQSPEGRQLLSQASLNREMEQQRRSQMELLQLLQPLGQQRQLQEMQLQQYLERQQLLLQLAQLEQQQQQGDQRWGQSRLQQVQNLLQQSQHDQQQGTAAGLHRFLSQPTQLPTPMQRLQLGLGHNSLLQQQQQQVQLDQILGRPGVGQTAASAAAQLALRRQRDGGEGPPSEPAPNQNQDSCHPM